MLELINDVLDLAKVESGDIPLDSIDLDPAPVISTCLNMIKSVAEQNGIVVKNHLPKETLPQINIDKLRVRQILLNLLSNAVKYNSTDGEVSVDCAVRGKSSLRISVSDTGTGIPEKLKERVFEPFDLLGAENSDIPGTGIGLAVSRKLAQRMGGDISFKCTPDQGTTVCIYLPLADFGSQ